MPHFDIQNLKTWFLSQKRDLPWREKTSPYAVLISEIMLQQTQVSVVIPYFIKWMNRFPSFQALAAAKSEDVLKTWEGLGYYSRAKNLQKAASLICKHWNGEMPHQEEEIAKLPGIGPYTTGAILAFAFHQKAAVVDGNVMRVLARYFALQEDIGKIATQKTLRTLAFNLLPDEKPWIIAEGLIELGALICKKIPSCQKCPLKASCQAYAKGLTASLPIKEKPKPSIKLFRTVPILLFQDQFLIRKIPSGSIMAGLHEFPYFEDNITAEELKISIQEAFQIEAEPVQKFPQVIHGFTHYRAHLTPFLLICNKMHTPEGYFWADKPHLETLAFSSGHRRILKQIFSSSSLKNTSHQDPLLKRGS